MAATNSSQMRLSQSLPYPADHYMAHSAKGLAGAAGKPLVGMTPYRQYRRLLSGVQEGTVSCMWQPVQLVRQRQVCRVLADPAISQLPDLHMLVFGVMEVSDCSGIMMHHIP